MNKTVATSILQLTLVLALVFVSRAPADDAAPAAATPAPFFYQDGDIPAVFLGDSITEFNTYSTFIETYVLSRYPAMKITFRNAGWSGDTSWLQKRGEFAGGLQRDVLSLKPKAVTIDFGMNDARGGDANYEKYVNYSTQLVKELEKSGARVALLTSPPEERYETGSVPAGSTYNLMLKKFADGLKMVADNEKIPFVDVYTPFVGYIEAGRKAGVLSTDAAKLGDPSFVRLTNDGVHPNWGGGLIMASIILQGLHAPAVVSSVSLDAAGHSIMESRGCKVAWQDSSEEDVLQFKRTDDALPWPMLDDPKVELAMKIPGFDPATTLNKYGLAVTGLKAASYTLSIDGHPIGVYSSNDLAAGINLGFVKQGPIYDQTQALLKAVMAKNALYFNRWRSVQIFQVPDWLKSNPSIESARTAELTRLDNLITAADKEIDKLRTPVVHTFKLTPVK